MPHSFRVAVLVILIHITTTFSQAQPLHKVTLAHWGHEKVFIYLPLYVAMDEGFMKDEGLDLEILYSGNDDQVFAAVISGSAQFGLADPIFAAISRERGGRGKVIATLVGRVSNWGVGRNADVPVIDDPRKLNGLRISSFPAPSTAYSILAEIKQKYRLEAMKIVELAPGSEIAAMERGDIDIALTGEPAISLAESRGYPVVLSVANYYGPFTFSGITTTDDILTSHPKEAQGIVNAIQRALSTIRSDPERTVKIASANFPSLPATVIRAAVNRMIHDGSIPSDARINSDAWQRTLQMRTALGDLKDPSSTLAIDNSFAERALQQADSSVQRDRSKEPADQSVKTSGPIEMASEGWVALLAQLISLLADVAGLLTFGVLLMLWRQQRLISNFPTSHVVVAGILLDKFKAARPRPVTAAEIHATLQDHFGRDNSQQVESFYKYIVSNFLRQHPAGGFVLRYHFLLGKHLLEEVSQG